MQAKKRRNDGFSSSSSSVGSSEDEVIPSGGDGIDLMKSMLRENYGAKSKKSGDVEGNREVVENGLGKTLNLVNQKGGEGKGGSDLCAFNNIGPKFKDFGGISEVISQFIMDVMVPLCHPEVPRHLRVERMTGPLLHGPPGCGKTKLAHAIANEARVPFYNISASELLSGDSGASEENIRDLFSKACRTVRSIVFIDEVDAIASKKGKFAERNGPSNCYAVGDLHG